MYPRIIQYCVHTREIFRHGHDLKNRASFANSTAQCVYNIVLRNIRAHYKMRKTLAVYCVTLCVEGIVKLRFFLKSVEIKKKTQENKIKTKKDGDNAGRQAKQA